MKYLNIFLLLMLSGGQLQAQKVYWSTLTPEDKVAAMDTGKRFIRHIENGTWEQVASLLAKEEVYFSGTWMEPRKAMAQLQKLNQDKVFQGLNVYGYQFDDFLETYTENPIIQEVYPAFDNHSIIVHAVYSLQGNREDALLVMKKKGGGWEISGLAGFGLPFEGPAIKPAETHEYREEQIRDARMILPVPADFSKGERDGSQVNFLLEGRTERDAVFQVMVDEKKSRMYFYTYKLVEYNHQHYDLSELTVRFLPYGILFDYTVVDLYGIKNKGITVGLEHAGKSVIIQFYAFLELYRERKDEIDYVFNQIEFID